MSVQGYNFARALLYKVGVEFGILGTGAQVPDRKYLEKMF
jgi:hypothetical protein